MAYSTKAKRGRKPKVRLSPHDHGNDRVQARVALFRHFRGDGGQGFEMSCCGRLMLVGCFDGLDQPAESILSALLEYAAGYWGNFGGGPKVSQFERRDKSHDNRWEDPSGEWFDAQDEKLRNAGHAARTAVHQVSVDRHWFPDMDSFWAAAIINRRILDKRAEFVRAGKPVPPELSIVGEVALDGDPAWDKLELLRAGAMALVGQQMRRAA